MVRRWAGGARLQNIANPTPQSGAALLAVFEKCAADRLRDEPLIPPQAMSDMAKNYMKSTKPDPPLRGLPGETQDATKLSPLRQLLKDALDTAAGEAAGLANGTTEVVVPILAIPHVVLHPTPDPKDPDCGYST